MVTFWVGTGVVVVILAGAHAFAARMTGRRVASRPIGGIVVAFLLALALTTVVWAAEIMPMTCNDLEPYSLLWYVMLCMGPSH